MKSLLSKTRPQTLSNFILSSSSVSSSSSSSLIASRFMHRNSWINATRCSSSSSTTSSSSLFSSLISIDRRRDTRHLKKLAVLCTPSSSSSSSSSSLFSTSLPSAASLLSSSAYRIGRAPLPSLKLSPSAPFTSVASSSVLKRRSSTHHLVFFSVSFRRHQHSNARDEQNGGRGGGGGGAQMMQLIIFLLRALARVAPHIYRSQFVQNLISNNRRVALLLLLGLPSSALLCLLAFSAQFVPYSNRLHFVFLGPSTELQLGETAYREVLLTEGNRVVSRRYSHAVSQVEAVCSALIHVLQSDASIPRGMKFSVQVIESSVANAFVLPNGSIFVYTGIFPIAQDCNGLATILGHELSHAIAHHAAEKIGFTSLLLIAYDFFRGMIETSPNNKSGAYSIAGMVGNFLAGTLAQAILPLAHSRAMETEADKIGLELMAKAGYNPKTAAKLWERMSEMEKKKTSTSIKPPEFLSTHPSSERRIANLQRWVEEADVLYQRTVDEAITQRRPLPRGDEKIDHTPILSASQIARFDNEAETAELSFRASALAVGEFGNLVRVKL